MQIVIPLKTGSNRVPDKNLRPFHGNDSLFDIKAQQLRDADVVPNTVWVSSEDEMRVRPIVERYGFNFLLRDPVYCDNDMPWSDVLIHMFDSIPGDDDLSVVTVTDPFFNAFRDAFDTWTQIRNREHDDYDSLCVVRPLRSFVLSNEGRPINWGWGPWHVTSQQLGRLYDCSFCLNIITRASAAKCRYHIGVRPYMYVHEEHGVDIDTMDDFCVAQMLWEQKR